MNFAEPFPRCRHQSAQVEDRIYVFGGYCDDFNNRQIELSTRVEVFDQLTENWELENGPTEGNIPPALYWGACTTIDSKIFVYGGFEPEFDAYLDTLYQLDTTNNTWTVLKNGLKKKYGSGMVAYKDNLFVFGGFEERDITRYSTIPVHLISLEKYNLTDDTWNSCITGVEDGVLNNWPPSCYAFSLTKIDRHRAVLFGGKDGAREMDDIYILDLESLEWTRKTKEGDWPEKRFRHAATCISGSKKDHCEKLDAHVLITGGVNSAFVMYDDIWLLDTRQWQWTLLGNDPRLKRYCHSATAVKLNAVITEVTVFGGESPHHRRADTVVLRFTHIDENEEDQIWELDIASGNQLGTQERLAEKQAMRQQHDH